MSQSPPIRVLIVDDHPMVRRGLAAFLLAYNDLALAGEAAGGEEALRMCEKAAPDVVLMDLKMPGLDGVSTTRALRERFPHIQVIALTSFQDKDWVRRALEAGAVSYLLKNVSADELAKAIQSAHSGMSTLAPEAISALVQTGQQASPQTPADGLTPRERDVLALMVEGLSNPGIAERLVVSRSTVKAHVSHILSKLDVSSRAAAIAVAFQRKLVN